MIPIDVAELALRWGIGFLVPLALAAVLGSVAGGLLCRAFELPEAGVAVVLRAFAVVLVVGLLASDGAALIVDETARAWSSLSAIGRGAR